MKKKSIKNNNDNSRVKKTLTKPGELNQEEIQKIHSTLSDRNKTDRMSELKEKSDIIGKSFGFVEPSVREDIVKGNIDKPFVLISFSETSKELKRERKEKQRLNKLKTKKLGSKKKREISFYSIPSENCIYDQYLPLHQLWTQYIQDVIQQQKGPALINKLLKADLHGAIIIVTKSKCPTFVGQKGIIIQETENTFKIITKENKLNIIPKEQCQFYLECCNQVVTIFGKHFCFRACDRANKKFKPRMNIEL
ncbi:hypothetical protein RB653_008539 [Dictyostelium firmibasis]|uniref:Ribonuclease P protein subunit p29 n=1 Tax=Dictyostelium firmibasis TaxID=79012 RepID=A0AAN7TSX6_9MYCE